MAQVLDAGAKFFQRSRRHAYGHGNLRAFAEIKALQSRLLGKCWVRCAELLHHPAQIAAQRGDGKIIANVERRELLRQILTVCVRVSPLREVIGKSFSKKMMAAQRLKCVMKDG